MLRIIIGFIKFYQYFLSSFFWGSCRFSPSCSHYAIEALVKHGLWKGAWLSVWRILRCNPWASGGHDPVP